MKSFLVPVRSEVVVEVDGEVVYRSETSEGVVVLSSAPFPKHWWDRHPLLGMVGSYLLWAVNISADAGFTKPKRWMKRLDKALNSRLL